MRRWTLAACLSLEPAEPGLEAEVWVAWCHQ